MRAIDKKESNVKDINLNWIITVGLIYVGIWLLIGSNYWASNKGNALQEGIADEMIRFHVLANSDTEEDQALKLKVKSQIVKELTEPLKDANNIEHARMIMKNEIPNIERVASDIIIAEGYEYDVNVELKDVYFPTKMYGDMTFPPGKYEALQVKIGEAKGKNWWCVMFPPLCFVEGTYNVVPEESKVKLEHVLTEEEYASLIKEGRVKVKAKSKLWDMMKSWQ